MKPALSGAAAVAAAGLAGAAGPAAAAALLVLVSGGALLLAGPATGAGLLVAMAHLDGITLILDRHLPVSTFKIVSALVLAALILTLPRNPVLTARPRPSPAIAFSLLFAVWILLAHLVSDAPAAGRDHTFDFLQTMMLVPIVGLTVATGAQLRRMALVLAASGAVSAVFVLLDTAGGVRVLPYAQIDDIGHWRGAIRSAGASAYNPTTAAHLMAVSLLVALTLAAHDRALRWAWAGMALLCILALPMMGARSGLLAAALGVVLLGISLRRHRMFPLFVLLVAAAGLAALPFVPATMWERLGLLRDFLDSGTTADWTLLRRLSYNVIGLEVWAQNPVAGVGPGSVPTIYASDTFRWVPGRPAEMRQLHNAYLEVAAEMGTVGLVLFLGAVLGAAGAALRAGRLPHSPERATAKAFGIAMTAFLFASLFMPNEDNKYMWILVALCARAASISRAAEEARP